MEVETGIEPVYKVLQTFASPLGHSTAGDIRLFDSTKEVLGADDETRTRDPHLGKVMRYQLRYIRIVEVRTSTMKTLNGSSCAILGSNQ